MLKTCTLIGLVNIIVRRTYAENSLEVREAYPVLPRTTECCQASTEVETRNYYDGYRGTAVTPYYSSGFDPLSIMASLAFLAFLFQSLVSLFDRSRSIRPVMSRQFTELKTLTEILDALDKHERSRNGKLSNVRQTRR
ncbi:uncharacterized protein LOC108632325 [Ceratina calcarata]|uniref:Uncharacterized protein LOC108632325 n=1 Tax=Ceratina calcarata TaxID=156304 RepID=A0AAJ7JGI7_9HYME|nr:uncharacterized protein LOC108632325 [Ceratina calcarata]